MKTRIKILIVLASSLILQPLAALRAGTSIDPVNRYAYGGNIGWVNAVADTNNGAVMGNYVCSGYLYSANVGWINLGSGSPGNNIQYQNNSATDFGVNNDGLGNLSGYAWGANIGWITFEQTFGKPKINLLTGVLSGYAWSANCGWISLSNAVAYVQTDYLYPGPLAPDGLPIPWLFSNFGTTNVNANADPDNDGMSNEQEYQAGTNPNDANSVLRITAQSFNSQGTIDSLTWLSEPTRLYYILGNTNLLTPTWQDSNLGLIVPSAGTTTTAGFTDTKAGAKFYRVQAVVPLSP
jgi:Bacterial TSP3 repeat